MKSLFSLALSALLLTGCQSSVLLYSEQGQWYRVSEVKLFQTLEIKPETTRVFIQDGNVHYAGSHTNPYRPHCAFELRSRNDIDSQLLKPGNFTVTRVQYEMEAVVEARPYVVAGLVVAGVDDGGSQQVHAGYHFWLDAGQDGPMRMTCYGVFEQQELAEPPTLDEIRVALGPVADIVLQ